MDNIIKETTTTIKEFDKKGKVVRETTTVIIERDRPTTNYPYIWNDGNTTTNQIDVKYGSE